LAILSTILTACCVINKKAATAVSLGWLVWTLTMVFTSWLYALQTTTIAGSLLAAHAIAELPSYAIIQRRSRAILITLTAIASTIMAYAIYTDSQRTTALPTTNQNPATTQPLIPPQSNNIDAAYNEAIIAIERKYPELNPDSHQYNKDIMNSVVIKYKSLLSDGLPSPLAATVAADTVMSERAPRQVYRCKHNVFQDWPCP
jgi:hypothetical protein